MWLKKIYAVDWVGSKMTSGTEETNIITVVLDENNLNINIYGIYSSLDLTDTRK